MHGNWWQLTSSEPMTPATSLVVAKNLTPCEEKKKDYSSTVTIYIGGLLWRRIIHLYIIKLCRKSNYKPTPPSNRELPLFDFLLYSLFFRGRERERGGERKWKRERGNECGATPAAASWGFGLGCRSRRGSGAAQDLQGLERQQCKFQLLLLFFFFFLVFQFLGLFLN